MKPDLKKQFFAAPPEQTDAGATPMEEQNTGVNRPDESETTKPPKARKKKGKDEVVVAQSPPSLPKPPPDGAAVLAAPRKDPKDEAEPDVEPPSGSAANASTSVPHYRPKEMVAAPSGYRKKAPPDAVIDDLPAIPEKRKSEKPLEDETPLALRPEPQRRRAPQEEPDSEPNPLKPFSSSSSSSGSISSRQLPLVNQRVW